MKPINQQQLRGMLFTDQYQLTMSQLYYRAGPSGLLHQRRIRMDSGLDAAGPCERQRYRAATEPAQ